MKGKEKNSKVKGLILLVSILTISALLPSSVGASTLMVSETGTWGPNAPTTTWTAPNATFSYSFLVDSNPTVSSYNLGMSFVAPFSSFTYTLAGNTVATTPLGIQWYSAQPGGLFNIVFSGGIFVIIGPQAYSGPENDPTILTGTYLIDGTKAVFCCPASGDVPISGNVVISTVSQPVPEPSTLAFMFLAVGCSAGFRLRHRAEAVLSTRHNFEAD